MSNTRFVFFVAHLEVIAKKEDGTVFKFNTICRIDTPVEIDYYRNGGILQTVLRNFLKKN